MATPHRFGAGAAELMSKAMSQSSLLDIVRSGFLILIALERFSKMMSKEKKIKGLESRKTL